MLARFKFALAQVRRVLAHADTEPLELFLGVLFLVWGLFMLVPLVDTFASSPSHDAMAKIAPEWLWGVYAAALGGLRIVGVSTRSTALRRSVAFVGAVTWLSLALQIMAASPSSVGWATFGVLAAGSSWVFLRLSVRP